MRIRNRISELRQSLHIMQSELGKCHIGDAQALAAKIDHTLEEWSFDLMHIPPDDRQKYRSSNGFYYP